MGSELGIVIVLILLYQVYTSTKRLGEKVQSLETRVKTLDAKNRYGDVWEQGLALSDSVREISAYESELYNAEQKVWNRSKSVTYWKEKLKSAQEFHQTLLADYERVKKAKPNKKEHYEQV